MLEETILIVIDDTEYSDVDGHRGWGEIRQRLTKNSGHGREWHGGSSVKCQQR